MAKPKAALAGRAWSFLRLALLWARKGGAFKRRLLFDLRLHLKTLRSGAHSDRLRYNGEREFSFDETPAFNFKMHRPGSMLMPRIPCITPNFDNDVEDSYYSGDMLYRRDRRSHSGTDQTPGDQYKTNGDDDDVDDGEDCVKCANDCEVEEKEEEEEIDSKAEEFIAKFYDQMKLQRQVSWLQYYEMLDRSIR